MIKSNPIAQTTKPQQQTHLPLKDFGNPSIPTKTMDIRDIIWISEWQHRLLRTFGLFSCKGSKLYSQVCRKKFCLAWCRHLSTPLTQLLVPVGSAWFGLQKCQEWLPLEKTSSHLPEIEIDTSSIDIMILSSKFEGIYIYIAFVPEEHWTHGLCPVSTTNLLSSCFWLVINIFDIQQVGPRCHVRKRACSEYHHDTLPMASAIGFRQLQTHSFIEVVKETHGTSKCCRLGRVASRSKRSAEPRLPLAKVRWKNTRWISGNDWTKEHSSGYIKQGIHKQLRGKKAMKTSNFCEFQHPNVPAEALRVLWLVPADPGKCTSFPKFGTRTV